MMVGYIALETKQGILEGLQGDSLENITPEAALNLEEVHGGARDSGCHANPRFSSLMPDCKFEQINVVQEVRDAKKRITAIKKEMDVVKNSLKQIISQVAAEWKQVETRYQAFVAVYDKENSAANRCVVAAALDVLSQSQRKLARPVTKTFLSPGLTCRRSLHATKSRFLSGKRRPMARCSWTPRSSASWFLPRRSASSTSSTTRLTPRKVLPEFLFHRLALFVSCISCFCLYHNALALLSAFSLGPGVVAGSGGPRHATPTQKRFAF